LSLRYLVFIVFLINFIFILISAIFAFIAIIQLGVQYSWLNLIIIWDVVSASCLVALSLWVAQDGGDISLLQAKISELIQSAKKENKQPTPVESPSTIETSDQNLVEKLSKTYLHPQQALKHLIDLKMNQGKTREQALKEIEEENT
jgi:hypothetical protein